MTKEFKNQSVLLYITMFLALISCILGFVNACSSKSNVNDSYMKNVGVNDVLNMFNNSKTYVVYVGRETCKACTEFLPTLEETQLEKNYITQYMDITQVDRKSDAWKELVEKLSVEVTTASDEDSSETVTDTFGNFLDKKGYTPCILVIKNGQQVAGFFGVKSKTNFQDWLSEYGI